MSDTEQEKPTEKVSNTHVPDIEVSVEGATGGTDEKANKGILGSLADKMKTIRQRKRSKSKSPEIGKDETRTESESPKKSFRLNLPALSPSKKGIANKIISMLNPTGGKDADDEEMENLCEEEVTEGAPTLLAPPEKDVNIASPSASVCMAENLVTYKKSSSIDSNLSDFSSLPDDDLCSPEDK